MIKNEVFPIGYSPIGSPNRPDRDRQPEDACDTEEPVVKQIADRLQIHPAVVCLKWAIQRGTAPIPMSANPKNLLANLQGVLSEPLTEEEMELMTGAEKNSRLIKGQVFLWPDAKGWEDLWT
jgi:alcohol dehydrogenase (NADP+)